MPTTHKPASPAQLRYLRKLWLEDGYDCKRQDPERWATFVYDAQECSEQIDHVLRTRRALGYEESHAEPSTGHDMEWGQGYYSEGLPDEYDEGL